MTLWRERAFQLLLVLMSLRFLVGALLPLSADEAYYWLWSQNLAAGYFDHPPAIAYVIRVGTLIFGDPSLGVRFGGLVLSVAATWFVWRSGALLLKDEKAGLLAALLFNATLMIAVETMAATPDAPLIATAAAFFFCLAKLQESQNARWWLLAGVAAGLGLQAKYAMFFLGAGALLWLVADVTQRRWLASPFPYLGALIAAAIFAPNIWWNANHGWGTFIFQFGRVSASGFTPIYLLEFLAAQFLLLTPFVFILAALGFARARSGALFLAAALCWPSLVYFLWHTMHDRVQGNWPCFLFPAFAVLAVAAMNHVGTGWTEKLRRFSRVAAIPFALLLLAVVYLQAMFSIVPLGRTDPLARLLAVGMSDVTDEIRKAQAQSGADAIVTTDYASTGWLRYYMPDQRVIAATEVQRWPDAQIPSAEMLTKPLLYVVENRRDQHAVLAADFTDVAALAEIPRIANGATVAIYRVYRVSGWRGTRLGRLP